jgi:tetratricopeptide (TPR) repeat protein
MARGATTLEDTQDLPVFICYSRTDLAFIDRLDLVLRPRGITLYIDRNDIAAFEDWRQRITDLIASSDVILVVLSPDAVVSEHCRNEIVFQGAFPDLDLDTPYDTAERLLRTGVSREPENFWPHFVLGRTLLGRGDFKGAELAFNVCISVDPKYARGFEQRALALAEQWRELGYGEVLERANDDSRRALELAGDDPSTFWPRGEMLQTLGLVREALDAYSRWMQLEEDILAKLSRSTGVQKAHDLAESLLKSRDGEADLALRTECCALLGFVHLLWRQPVEADDFAARALHQDPNHAHARTVKGMLLCRRGQFAQGIAELETAIRLDPTAYRALLSRAEACEATGDRARALRAWADVANTSGHVSALPAWMRATAAAARERLGGAPMIPANAAE